MIFVFPCFTQYDNLQVNPCCCKWHYFILFNGWVIFYCVRVCVCACLRVCACTQQNNVAEVINSTVAKEYNPLTQTTLQTIPTCRAKWRGDLSAGQSSTPRHCPRIHLETDSNREGLWNTRAPESRMGTTKRALFLLRSTNVIRIQWLLARKEWSTQLPCCKPQQVRALSLVHKERTCSRRQINCQ